MNLKSLATVLLLLLFFAFKVIAQPQNVIDTHFKALMAHDVKAIANGYSDSAKVYSPNWEGAKVGPPGLTNSYSRYFASTPDLAYNVINTIYTDKNAVVQFTMTGTLSNPENGTPDYMKGKKYTLNCCAVFTIENGKITAETDYFDQVAFLRQVGFFDQR